MPLDLTVDSLDAVPEPLRGAYVEKDGKFVLDAVLPDVSGLKHKNQDLIARLTAAQKRAALLGDRPDEDIEADLKLASDVREKKLRAEGQFEELRKQMIDQHAKELAGVKAKGDRYSRKLYDVMARREAEAAIREAGGNPKLLLPHLLPFIQVAEQGEDDFIAQVVDAKGNPRIADGQANPMTITQLVETFKADETFGSAFAANGSSGSGARGSGAAGGGTGGEVVLSAAEKHDPKAYRRAKAEAEKRGVPLRIGG